MFFRPVYGPIAGCRCERSHSFRGGATGPLRDDAVRDLRDPARAIDAAAAAYAGGALSDDASVVVAAFPAPRSTRGA